MSRNRRRYVYLYLAIALVVLVVLAVGDFVFHWPATAVSLGIAVLSVGNIVLSLRVVKKSSRHG